MPQNQPPVTAYPANPELWYFNGLALQSSYWNLSTFGGSRSGIPVLRGQNYALPYRAGQSWRPKFPDQRTVSLTMWIDGSGSSAGWPSADTRLAFNNNWQQLRQAFFTRGSIAGSLQGQLQRNWYLTQGGTNKLVTSTAMAEIAGSMDLTMHGRVSAAFTVDLLLADPYFLGPQIIQNITTSGGTINNPGEGVAGEGFASAVHTFTVVCSAATTVTNVSAGVSFTIAPGPAFPVTVNCLNGTVTDSTGANVSAKFTHAGGRLWMGLDPGSNVITNSAGTATFTFNPPYI